MATPKKKSSALSEKKFRNYFYSQLFSTSGSFLQTLVLSDVVFKLTNDPKQSGFVVGLSMGPMALLSIAGGMIADGYDRKKLLFYTQLAGMSLAALLFVLSWQDCLGIIPIYIFAVLTGIVGALDNPTRLSFTAEVVKKEHIASAMSLNSSVMTASQVLGPTLGGFILAFVSPAAAFGINALTFLPLLAVLHTMQNLSAPVRKKETMLNQVKAGFRWIMIRPDFKYLFILSLFIGLLLRSYSALLPAMNKQFYHDNKIMFGLLNAAIGLGSLVCAAKLPLILEKVIARRNIIAGSFIAAVSLIGLGFFQNFVMVIVMLFAGGFAFILIISTISTLVSYKIRSDLRGRVIGPLYFAVFSGIMIGAFIIGVITKIFGIAVASYSYGFLLLVVAFVIARSLNRHNLLNYKIPRPDKN